MSVFRILEASKAIVGHGVSLGPAATVAGMAIVPIVLLGLGAMVQSPGVRGGDADAIASVARKIEMIGEGFTASVSGGAEQGSLACSSVIAYMSTSEADSGHAQSVDVTAVMMLARRVCPAGIVSAMAQGTTAVVRLEKRIAGARRKAQDACGFDCYCKAKWMLLYGPLAGASTPTEADVLAERQEACRD